MKFRKKIKKIRVSLKRVRISRFFQRRKNVSCVTVTTMGKRDVFFIRSMFHLDGRNFKKIILRCFERRRHVTYVGYSFRVLLITQRSVNLRICDINRTLFVKTSDVQFFSFTMVINHFENDSTIVFYDRQLAIQLPTVRLLYRVYF